MPWARAGVGDALSAYIRAENFEERKQERGHLVRAVLEYMKRKE